MGACLFVAELASTALAAGWLGVRGLGGRAQASWVAGRAWTRWLGASELGGWAQAGRAAASSTKTGEKVSLFSPGVETGLAEGARRRRY